MLAEVQKVIEAEWRPRMYKALSFNGVNNNIVIPDSDSLDLIGAHTFILWLNVTKPVETWVYMLTKDAWASANYFVILDTYNDINYFVVDSAGNYYNARTKISLLGVGWVMVACRYDLNELTVFHNDEIKARKVIGDITPLKTNTTNLIIGGTAGRFYNNFIGFVRIYNRALSESEIKYLYYNPFDPLDEEHLVLDLNPAGIDVANGKWWDLSGKGNHGTIYGATEVSLVKKEVVVQ